MQIKILRIIFLPNLQIYTPIVIILCVLLNTRMWSDTWRYCTYHDSYSTKVKLLHPSEPLFIFKVLLNGNVKLDTLHQNNVRPIHLWHNLQNLIHIRLSWPWSYGTSLHVVGIRSNNTTSTYHHWSCEFDSHKWVRCTQYNFIW